MSEKQISARTQQKIDLTANWEKATNFVPKKGEIIVYSDGGGTGVPKMKVGDGTTKVGSLKFIEATMPDASTKVSGIVNTGEQTFGGDKTFRGYLRVVNGNNGVSAIALGSADSSTDYLYLDRSQLGFGKANADSYSTTASLNFSRHTIECSGSFVSYNSSSLGKADKPWPKAYITNLIGNADTATTATTASKVANSLSINGKSYNGSAAIDVGVIGAEYGGSGQNTLAKSAEAYVGALSEAATSYALNDEHKILTNIPAGTSTYKIPLSNFYTYMKGKMDSIYQAKGTYLTSLPVASSSALGGVKIGSGLTVAEDGTISAAAAYTLPTASSTVKGGIKVGTGLTMSSETLNHSNSITAKTAYGSTATTASANGGKIVVTDVKYDAQGHITGSTDRTITLSQTTYTLAGLMGSTAKGSATQPVYWNGTAWTNTTHTLGKSVPADAKFTDTVYSLPTASSTLGGVKTTSTVSATTGLTACPIIDGVVYYKDTNNTYTLAGLVGSTAIGTATNPIYWDGSKFVKTTYTLGKSVPADAKFTDTVYSLPTASSTLGGVKTTSTVTSTSGLTACPIIEGVPYYKNNTYTLAGLMGSTAKGSATQPVYWNGTAWTNTTHTLGASVPANAKFTDTVYTLPTASSSVLGGIKLGTGLTAASDGTVNVSVGGATITLKTWTDADVA